MKISQEFKKYFLNTSWLFLGKFIYAPLNFLTGILIIRYLGAEQFGVFSYASSFAGLFLFISFLGLDSLVIRDIVKNDKKKDEILGTALVLKVIGSFISIMITLIAMFFAKNDLVANVLILIIAFSAFFQTFNVIDFYFRAKVLSKYGAIARICSSVFTSLLKLLVVYIKLPLLYFAIVVLIEHLILSISYIASYSKLNLSVFKWKFNKEIALNLLKNSWFLILATSFVVIYMRIDQIMIQKMLGNQAAGLYASTVKLLEIWYFIPVLITDSIYPAIIKAKALGEDLFNKKQQNLYNFLAWQAIFIAIPVSIFSKQIMQFLYGSQYILASSTLSIIIWSVVFTSLNQGLSKSLLADNFVRITFFCTFVGAIVNVIMNVVLIPKYGIKGAAIATVVSYILSTFSVILINKTRKHALMMFRSMVFGLSELKDLKKIIT